MRLKITSWYERLRNVFQSRGTRERADKYVRLLEDELARAREEITRERADNARLRAENRALVNSLLGTAGIPPIETEHSHSTGVLPVRRRSWAQIATAREIEAAREARAKERESRRSAEPA